jgi:hypothetical protein
MLTVENGVLRISVTASSSSSRDSAFSQQQQYLTDAARLKKCTSTVQSYSSS